MCFVDSWESAPSFFEEDVVRARKEHRCDECGRRIQRGEQYHRVRGVWDGDFQAFKTCCRCERVRTKISDHPEMVAPFGELACCLREYNREKRHG